MTRRSRVVAVAVAPEPAPVSAKVDVRRGRVAGTGSVDDDRQDVERVAVADRRDEPGRRVDRVEQGAVTDDDVRGPWHSRRPALSTTTPVTVRRPCRGSAGAVGRYGIDAAHTAWPCAWVAVRIIRQVEVDGREGVALARHRDVDGIDAAERMGGRIGGRTTAAERHGRGRVAGTGRVDGDAGDGAGCLDVRGSGRAGARPGDRDGRRA